LKREQQQLTIAFPPEKNKASNTISIEDVGIVNLDLPRITITQALLSTFIENNAAVLSCDARHLPGGIFIPITANHIYTAKLRYQLESSKSLRKNLWQQTVTAKIQDQAL